MMVKMGGRLGGMEGGKAELGLCSDALVDKSPCNSKGK